LSSESNKPIKKISMQVARINPEKSIPHAVLSGASGLAILTVVKAGAILTYKLGTGLVVARRSDGSWSAPSAILSGGFGWGAQVIFCCYILFCMVNF
jgi:lipid-binding SYLF domain-containing protein